MVQESSRIIRILANSIHLQSILVFFPVLLQVAVTNVRVRFSVIPLFV